MFTCLLSESDGPNTCSLVAAKASPSSPSPSPPSAASIVQVLSLSPSFLPFLPCCILLPRLLWTQPVAAAATQPDKVSRTWTGDPSRCYQKQALSRFWLLPFPFLFLSSSLFWSLFCSPLLFSLRLFEFASLVHFQSEEEWSRLVFHLSRRHKVSSANLLAKSKYNKTKRQVTQ